MSSPFMDPRDQFRKISRLGGRRRVANPNIPLEEEMPLDVDNTANPGEGLPPIPQEGAIQPTGMDDVRANKVITPEEQPLPSEPEESFMSKLGKYLTMQPPQKEVQLLHPEQEVPLLHPEKKLALLKPEQKLDLFQPTEAAEKIEKAPEDQQGLMQKLSKYLSASPQEQPTQTVQPETPSVQGIQPEQPQEKQAEIGEEVQLGASENAYSQPEVQKAVNDMFQLQITPELQRQIIDAQNVMDELSRGVDEYHSRLDEHQKEIRDRIASNQLSTQDKIVMGLALLAPAFLAGAIGGKEAFFGGLSGGSKALGDVLSRREKQTIEDQDKLSEIAKLKEESGVKLSQNKLKQSESIAKIVQSLPGYETKQRFARDGFIGKDGKLLLDTGNEFLPLRADAVKNDKKIEQFETKDMPKLNELVRGFLEQQRISKSLHEMADWQRNKDQNTKWPLTIFDPVKKAFKSYEPYFGDEVIDPETGNKVKIKTRIEILQNKAIDAYQTFKEKVRAFGQTKEHAMGYLSNPYDWESFKAGKNNPDTLDQQTHELDEKYHGMLKDMLQLSGADTSRIDEEYESSPYRMKLKGKNEDTSTAYATVAAKQSKKKSK